MAQPSPRPPDPARRARPATELRVIDLTKPRRGDKQLPTDDTSKRFAQCRSLGHEWRHGPREINWDGVPIFVSACADCATERRVYIPSSGANVRRVYKYPDGYQRRGEDRLTTTQWRRVLIVSLG